MFASAQKAIVSATIVWSQLNCLQL